MSERTFKLTVSEDELKAVIQYNINMHFGDHITIERSARIHDLTKRLCKNNCEAETNEKQYEVAQEQAQEKQTDTSGW